MACHNWLIITILNWPIWVPYNVQAKEKVPGCPSLSVALKLAPVKSMFYPELHSPQRQ